MQRTTANSLEPGVWLLKCHTSDGLFLSFASPGAYIDELQVSRDALFTVVWHGESGQRMQADLKPDSAVQFLSEEESLCIPWWQRPWKRLHLR
jgi:hypothetical protein